MYAFPTFLLKFDWPTCIRIVGEATTKKMPITGTPLNGKDTYKKLLRYFTTTDISPEMINIEGERQLKSFYNQVSIATDGNLAVINLLAIFRAMLLYISCTRFKCMASKCLSYTKK